MIDVRTALFTAILVSTTALSSACKKDEAGAAAAKGGSLDTVTARAGDVNGKVPAELADKIKFAAVKVDDGQLGALVPSAWEDSKHMPGRYKPAEGADLGFRTSFSVGTNCDGSCEPKDWAAAADKVDFAQFKGEQFTVVSDQPLEGGGRILVARAGDTSYVVAARWKEGARRYASCHATLDGAAAAAATDAFVEACTSFEVLKW